MSNVTDITANRNDKIANAAHVLGRAKQRILVFKTIYSGKKQKSVSELMNSTGMSRVRVLQEADKLAAEHMVEKIKKEKQEVNFRKIEFYTKNRDTILKLAENKKKLENFPTKINPRVSAKEFAPVIQIQLPKSLTSFSQITIDDIDSFDQVKQITNPQKKERLYESEMKEGLKSIIGESGEFVDWGGETDDLYTTRIEINRKRVAVAFALKGKATTGILTPKKMGKNGDQISRLFKSPADVYMIVYQGQISESVVDLMKQLAIAKSAIDSSSVSFGVIDEKDFNRLIEGYQEHFG